jgi:general stress protein 26
MQNIHEFFKEKDMAVSTSAAVLKIGEILANQKFAVIATDADDHIHTSLVCFTVSKDMNCFFFGTPRTTRKYRYLKKNNKLGFNVSDNRNVPEDTHNAYAVTAHGEALELFDSDRDDFAKALIKRFPHLEDFYNDPATAIFTVKIKEYSITSNFQNVVTITMGKDFCV